MRHLHPTARTGREPPPGVGAPTRGRVWFAAVGNQRCCVWLRRSGVPGPAAQPDPASPRGPQGDAHSLPLLSSEPKEVQTGSVRMSKLSAPPLQKLPENFPFVSHPGNFAGIELRTDWSYCRGIICEPPPQHSYVSSPKFLPPPAAAGFYSKVGPLSRWPCYTGCQQGGRQEETPQNQGAPSPSPPGKVT